jgi:nudix-type nucleoside diphosphatase (YffH/AdpP family)
MTVDAVTARLTVLDRKTAHHRFARVDIYTLDVVGPSGRRQTLSREVEDHGPACAVLAFDPIRRSALLVRQQRPAVALTGQPDAIADGLLLEVAAGLIDAGESAADAALREAREELGLAVVTVTPVGAAYSMPGLSTEKIALFLAECDFKAALVEAGGGLVEEGEDIERVELSLDALAGAADAGTIADLKTLALVQTLRLRRPDLFGA